MRPQARRTLHIPMPSTHHTRATHRQPTRPPRAPSDPGRPAGTPGDKGSRAAKVLWTPPLPMFHVEHHSGLVFLIN